MTLLSARAKSQAKPSHILCPQRAVEFNVAAKLKQPLDFLVEKHRARRFVVGDKKDERRARERTMRISPWTISVRPRVCVCVCVVAHMNNLMDERWRVFAGG